MQLPAFTPTHFQHLKAIASDQALFESFIKASDLVLFFEIASDDETWSERHEDFISSTLQWATSMAYEDKMTQDEISQVAAAIHKHYPVFKSVIPRNITVELKDGKVQENGLLIASASEYLRRVMLRECRDKESTILPLSQIDKIEYAPIHSYINTAASPELLIMGQEDLNELIERVMPWQMTRLSEMVQKRLSVYLTDDNVVPMLIDARKRRLLALAQHSADYINKRNSGFHLAVPSTERLSLEFYNFDDETRKIFEQFRDWITDIVCKGTVADNPSFGRILKKSPKLIAIDISETFLFSGCFLDIPMGVKEINLSGCPWLSKETFKQLADICPSIEQMDLTNNTHIKYGTWSDLLKFKQLQRLSLAYCHQISSSDFSIIIKSCPSLTHLTIKDCAKISDDGFYELAHLKQLRDLNLSHCSLTDNALVEIGNRCNKLLSLDISNCNQITEKGIIGLVKNAGALLELNIERCRFTPSTLEEIRQLRPLLKLII